MKEPKGEQQRLKGKGKDGALSNRERTAKDESKHWWVRRGSKK